MNPIVNDSLSPPPPKPWLESRSESANALVIFLIILFILLALVGNVLVICAVFLYQRLRAEVSSLFIVNLSITDLCSATVVMISSAVAVAADSWPMGKAWCSMVCGANYCFIIVSMLTLSLISLDRYMAIHHSLRYKVLITRPKVLLLIAYTWVQGFAFGLAPILYDWVEYDYWEITCAIQWHIYGNPVLTYVIVAFILCFMLPGVVLTVAYCKVLNTAKKIKPRPRPAMILATVGAVGQSQNRLHADPNRSLADPNISLADPNRAPPADPNRSLADPNRLLADSSRSLVDPNRAQPADPNRLLADSSRSLADPNISLADPNRAPPADPNRAPPADPNRSLADPNRSLADPNRSLADPNRSLADPNRLLADSSRSLAYPNRSLVEPSRRPTCEECSQSQRQVKSPSYSESTKAVRGLLIVVLAFFICMTPFSLTKLYKVCVPVPDALPGVANIVATFFQYLSSVVNPLIYGLFRRDFQKAFLFLLWRSLRQRNTSDTAYYRSSTFYRHSDNST